MRGLKTIFCISILLLSDCHKESSEGEVSTKVESSLDKQTIKSKENTTSIKARGPSAMTPIIPIKRVPIIGGCSIDCNTPQKAAFNFLIALLQSPEVPFSKEHNPQKNPMLFINSRTLRVNSINVAEPWHILWLEGRFKDRTNKIQELLLEFRSPLNDVLKESDSLTLIQEGLSVDPSEAYSFFFMAPGLERPWRLLTHKRGTEWVINSIEHSP
jgi:hypothetical protein